MERIGYRARSSAQRADQVPQVWIHLSVSRDRSSVQGLDCRCTRTALDGAQLFEAIDLSHTLARHRSTVAAGAARGMPEVTSTGLPKCSATGRCRDLAGQQGATLNDACSPVRRRFCEACIRRKPTFAGG